MWTNMRAILKSERRVFFRRKELNVSRVCVGRFVGGRSSNMSSAAYLAIVFLILVAGHSCQATGKSEERKNLKTIFDLLIGISNGFYSESNGTNGSSRLDCPLCDSSVFSYCSEKLLHDACCCLNPYEHKLPLQCKYADCGFLHANSCREHKLITACCCSKLL